MNDIDEIRERINQRKTNRYKKTLNDYHFMKLYNSVIKMMVVMIVLLAVFTYMKIAPSNHYIQDYILANTNYIELKEWIGKQFYSFFPNNMAINVSSQIEYKHINDNLYTNSTNEVVNFMDGRVIYKGEQELLGNYITILMKNNIEVTFGNMTDIFVNEYDLVEQGTILGTCQDNVLIVFRQGQKEIDYETFKKITAEN